MEPAALLAGRAARAAGARPGRATIRREDEVKIDDAAAEGVRTPSGEPVAAGQAERWEDAAPR
jgi:hypothetical protein